MPAKKRKGAAMVFDFGHDLAGQIEKVMLEEANDMSRAKRDRLPQAARRVKF